MSTTTANDANGHPPLRQNGAAEPGKAGASEAGSVAEAVAEGLAARVAQSPYGTLAAAFAVGYVAGGGLFTKTTARVIQLGARLAMIPQVREPLLDMAEVALDSVLEKAKPKGP